MQTDFDIALLKLSEEVDFGPCASPACLPSQEPIVGAQCFIWANAQRARQRICIVPTTSVAELGEVAEGDGVDCHECL